MWDVLYSMFVVALFAGLIVGGALIVRAYLGGSLPAMPLIGPMFGPPPERRLDVVEQANVDGRRRLLLVRRDEIEHLIMTGGPVDVVIETGIGQRRPHLAEIVDPPAAVFTRQPRKFGQAVGES
ncbi:MAG: flagellar biosynthetic protein FliO [Hyphomicrobium sp.]